MKSLLCALFMLFSTYGFAQESLIKDIDFDGINDTIYIDFKTKEIVCKLSSQGFKTVKSKPLETLSDNARLGATKNGFKYACNWMRSGYTCQFRFSKSFKNVQLIGMSRYELGNAANDGSGESSVNLLTHDYIGNWNYFDANKTRLIKIPTIKTKLIIAKTFLDGFSELSYSEYADQCAELYNKEKKRLISGR